MWPFIMDRRIESPERFQVEHEVDEALVSQGSHKLHLRRQYRRTACSWRC